MMIIDILPFCASDTHHLKLRNCTTDPGRIRPKESHAHSVWPSKKKCTKQKITGGKNEALLKCVTQWKTEVLKRPKAAIWLRHMWLHSVRSSDSLRAVTVPLGPCGCNVIHLCQMSGNAPSSVHS